MKQLTDEVFAQVRDALASARVYMNHVAVANWQTPAVICSEALAALDTAQPEPVNAMLVEALQAAENLEHEALVALSEATYELKVGNTYTTATDTYKAHNDLIHRLDKILNSQYRDRKRAALTAAKQAQPEQRPVYGKPGTRDVDVAEAMKRWDAAQQAQPEPEGWKPSDKPMTNDRARYFMERFKHEEKLLGPNEQSAVDFVIAMLQQAQPEQRPVYGKPNTRDVDVAEAMKRWDAAQQAQPEPIGTPEQAARFLAKSLKPEEIGGAKRNERLRELMRWFDRFIDGNANPKWFRDHAYELAYAIATQQAQPERALAGLRYQWARNNAYLFGIGNPTPEEADDIADHGIKQGGQHE